MGLEDDIHGVPAGEQTPVERAAEPVRGLLGRESAGGLVLLGAVVAALVIANSPAAGAWERTWSAPLAIELGSLRLEHTLREWINDALMMLFFLVVGMEVKRELVIGDLSSPSRAALPMAAAIGGMLVPGLLYLARNPSGPEAAGWGIAVATDIAFALGLLALLGDRVPRELRVLLLSIAVVDDIGAVIIIAAVYSDAIEPAFVLLSVAMVGVAGLMRVIGVRTIPPYVLVGVLLWLATIEAGVHPTVGGVALGLLAPTAPVARPGELRLHGRASRLEGLGDLEQLHQERGGMDSALAHDMSRYLLERVPVTERLTDVLHPWTAFVVLPLFALANAGIRLDPDTLEQIATSSVAQGVVLGLVVGKPIGIVAGAAIALKLGARLPPHVRLADIVSIAVLAGLGFTMSLFISAVAFDGHPDLLAEAAGGVLGASIVAAVLGLGTAWAWPWLSRRLSR